MTCAGAAALLAATAGCDGNFVPVRGTVQRNDVALTEGRVVFTPVGGGKSAFGETDAGGAFELSTDGGRNGAPPGTYRIRVIQTKITDGGKQYTSFEPPRDSLWEVVTGQANEFVVNIREQDGWRMQLDK